MKFVPANNYIIGRTVIRAVHDQLIIRVDETKQSKFVLVDAVGDGVSRVKAGDILLAKKISTIAMDGMFRPMVEEEDVAFFISGSTPSDLKIQTEDGQRFVAFGHPEAARCIAESATPRAPRVTREFATSPGSS